MTLDIRLRINVQPGTFVKIQEKLKNDTSLIPGIVKEIVTKSPFHESGIMVFLENGVEGRVKEIVEDISTLDLSEKIPFELINLLEVKLRELIVRCIGTQQDWWKTLPQDVQDNAKWREEKDSKIQKIMKMNKHSKIDQIDFADLERIITKRDFWKNHFKNIFLDEKQISTKLKEISTIRNHIDHSKSISRDNEQRLRIYCKDIFDLMKNYS
jgi:uncharacterized repeat protein (TIGR03833 family)